MSKTDRYYFTHPSSFWCTTINKYVPDDRQYCKYVCKLYSEEDCRLIRLRSTKN